METLEENTSFIGYTVNENWGLWNFNVYLNQRHLAFGLLMVTLALYLFMDWLEAGTAHEEKGILWIKNRIFSKEVFSSRVSTRFPAWICSHTNLKKAIPLLKKNRNNASTPQHILPVILSAS